VNFLLSQLLGGSTITTSMATSPYFVTIQMSSWSLFRLIAMRLTVIAAQYVVIEVFARRSRFLMLVGSSRRHGDGCFNFLES
jgi:hypothetical protein